MKLREPLKNLDKIPCKEYLSLIKNYIHELSEIFGEKLVGVLVFGSVAKGLAKPLAKAESDVDLIILIKDLPPLKERIALQVSIVKERRLPSIVQPIFMTPEELRQHVRARAGWVFDALHDGVVIYDPEGALSSIRKEFLEKIKKEKVERKPYGWVWPIKAGEKLE